MQKLTLNYTYSLLHIHKTGFNSMVVIHTDMHIHSFAKECTLS